MKKQSTSKKTNFLKKIFIKICRLLGYEIIDQSNYFVPTLKRNLDENLNIPGKKSITIPLGETKITRKISSLKIIFRSCTSVNMLTQSKKRLFESNKSEYTFRSLNSIIKAANFAKSSFPNINIDIAVIDHNSSSNDLIQIKKQLQNSKLKNSITSLDVNKFINKIDKINSKKETVSENQISNMSNIHESLLLADRSDSDLIYFVEDDYIHQKDAFYEMIFSYERISSQLNNELILCPIDYPYLYIKPNLTNIFLGTNKHWRRVDETLCTFLTSKLVVKKHWNKFISMCLHEHYPFEQPLHDIYKDEFCLSPIPSLAFHCTNINSVFGLSPNINWKKIWDENGDY